MVSLERNFVWQTKQLVGGREKGISFDFKNESRAVCFSETRRRLVLSSRFAYSLFFCLDLS